MRFIAVAVALCSLLVAPRAFAAGTLAPSEAGAQPIVVIDHLVEVSITNGFARTEVTQVFENRNARVIEGIYTLPLPRSAALSEMTITTDDETLFGEVIPRRIAEEIYQQQRDAGASAGIATKEGYQRFVFRVASIPANSRVTVTFAYYQPPDVDMGVGRYLYPLEEGGTEEPGPDVHSNIEGTFRLHVVGSTSTPVSDIRVPHFEAWTQLSQSNPNGWDATVTGFRQLDQDVVLYYDLSKDQPGRMDMVAYRPEAGGQGTFMLLLTPGTDLASLPHGADFVFVLDVSGSMESKLPALKSAVGMTLQSLGQADRFRIVTFAGTATDITGGWQNATPAAVQDAIARVDALAIQDSTNLHAGIMEGLQGIDADRPTAMFLVTDGVANNGDVDGPAFVDLLSRQDVRVFGFLMSNSANWPLMQLITETTGGFYAPISNDDDISLQMLTARSKVTHEAMHDFSIELTGGGVHDQTPVPGTANNGEQLFVLGHYDEPGPVTAHVHARVTGREVDYTDTFVLPSADATYPELERIWAVTAVSDLEYRGAVGLTPADAIKQPMEDIGVQYQIVTDQTSMILLTEEDFARFGIDPRNRERTLTEEEARQARNVGAQDSSADPGSYVSSGGGGGGGGGGWGGGAVSLTDIAIAGAALTVLALAIATRRRRQ